ncbi:MAG: hypothetical protein ACI8W8_001251 [Rhodothermales bacterium]|jgi:hypothetical protein
MLRAEDASHFKNILWRFSAMSHDPQKDDAFTHGDDPAKEFAYLFHDDDWGDDDDDDWADDEDYVYEYKRNRKKRKRANNDGW